ncbi:MAG TPA: hypothetical protein VEU77_13140 [Candidatus Acidoferrales bacterium]|nr:hypothetical protein [Candidatus Acidoferrales bacterium]
MPEEIKALEQHWSGRARHRVTLEGLVSAWEAFSLDVAAGYRAGVYDYTNELSRRDMLAQAIDTSQTVRSQVAARVEVADARLQAATVPTEAAIQHLHVDRVRWWWFRRPLSAGRELVDDLKREGQW